MNKPIIAFIDVLATKESVNVSNQAFEFLITEFNRELCTNAIRLNEADKISLFSDCAFMQFRGGINDAIGYLRRIREVLFSKQIYFKCAIAEGDLEGSDFDPFSGINKAIHIKKVKSIVSYRYFGADSVNVYALHEKFKGIGFFVDSKLVDRYKATGCFVSSGFYADPTINTYVKFWDIGFNPPLLGALYENDSGKGDLAYDVQFIDSLLKSLLYSKAKKREYARYYISTLISMVRSSDFTKMYYDSINKTWAMYPVIFKRIYIDGFYVKHGSTVLGLDSVFFCLINEIFQNRLNRNQTVADGNEEPNEFEDGLIEVTMEKLTREIASRKGLIERMRRVPHDLLHPRNAQLILEKYAALGL